MDIRKDKLALNDELFTADGQLIIPSYKQPKKIIGVLDLINPITGKPMMRFHNDVIIPGATYILEKFFNKRSNFGMPTLSADLAVNNTALPTQDNLKDEFVFGFVLGNGGVESADVVRAVKFKDKSVNSIMPIRVVPTTSDLSPTEAAKYAMKKQVGNKFYYYAKRFDTDIVIRHLFTDGSEIPSNIDQTETSLGLLVFGEAVLNITAMDLREFYMDQFGSIDNCRFNSIGLVAGFVANNDFAGVRTVTKINIPNMFLKDTEATYKFTYKLYAI